MVTQGGTWFALGYSRAIPPGFKSGNHIFPLAWVIENAAGPSFING